jgi:hypothetical protein
VIVNAMLQSSRLAAVGLMASMPVLSAAVAAESGDLRALRIGMAVSEMPATGYTDFNCTDAPSRQLSSWSEWASCPAATGGLHAVSFRYDDSNNELARITDKDEGTKIAGQPVLLAALIGDDGRLDGLRIETDPKARLYQHKKAFLFGLQVRARYGDDGWTCTQGEPATDEQPIGGVFVKEHCEKTANGRHFVVDRELFRRPDKDLREFVGGTQVLILRQG